MKRDIKLLVIIPAYNEEDSIAQVVTEVKQNILFADVLVVNDGSTDDTSRRAEQADAFVIDLPYNLGIGGAVQTGYKFANEMGYDIVARVDGDGQHDISELMRIIEPVVNGAADVVIGSRYLEKNRGKYKASVPRSIGIKLFALIISAATRRKLTDTTSGFQAANRKAAKLLASECPQDYPEIESIVLLHRSGLHISEVPVSMSERTAGRSSISGFRSMYYVIKVLLGVFVSLLRGRPQREIYSDG